MKNDKNIFRGLRSFIPLWATQSLSTFGSSMTSYALIIWSYQQMGSALSTALLSVCSYAPYVLFSIFAGALSDKWNKKYTMLICDSFAALSTVCVFLLFKMDLLEVWHLYLVNALNGLMNTLQQPASDVAVTMLTPKDQYQRVGGMRSLSNSLVTILTPAIATALLVFGGLSVVIAFDFISFGIAFLTLAFFIKIPETPSLSSVQTSLLSSIKEGLGYLKNHRGILDLMLFLAAINLVASMYNAALPAMLISKNGGSSTALGILNTCTGIANLLGSILASLLPAPKSRTKVICNTLLFSMSTENFLLAFGRSTPIWCIGAFLGWTVIPIMSTNMDVLFRSHIPLEMQGRIYSLRNSFQFFTIPIGYLLGGFFVDKVFEPFMKQQSPNSILTHMFGAGMGSGAAMLFMFLGFAGVAICLFFRRDKYIKKLEG